MTTTKTHTNLPETHLMLMPFKFDAESTKKWEALQATFNNLCSAMLTHLDTPVPLNQVLKNEHDSFNDNYVFEDDKARKLFAEDVGKEVFEEAVQMYERASSWLFESVKFKQYQDVPMVTDDYESP